MQEPVITIDRLGKKYTLGTRAAGAGPNPFPTLRDSIVEGARRVATGASRAFSGTRTLAPTPEDFWALRDVSFEIQQGEIVGIVGRNGAGKSTLLKILSRITEPTEGTIGINGRVASLLEVGTGFHPELTGRENVYLNGAVLGMTRAEIARKFDAIVEFAEVDKFLDTPVKRYSSGMYVRLAFAVAAHLEPDVLIIDEVLAVGDADFQKKCLGKMEDVAGQEHRTILFVSHNMVAIKSMCRRAIWLENGRVKEDGNAADTVTRYLKSSSTVTGSKLWPRFSEAPGGLVVRFRSIAVKPSAQAGSDVITMETPLSIEIEFWNRQPGIDLAFTIHVINEEHVVAFSSSSEVSPEWGHGPFPVGLFKTTCHVPGNWLNSGVYKLTVFVVEDLWKELSQHREIVSFEVLDLKDRPRGYYMGKEPGVFFPVLDWTTVHREAVSGD
jgi:lipopolysaccharide transport system ATP-binding protein